MFSKILEKLFGSSSPFSLSSSPQAPKTFAQKKRSIFFNRYAGVVYFLICWHFFGSVVLSAAKEKAKKDGTDPYQTIGSKNARRIEIKDFNIRVLPIEAEKKESSENPKN